MFTIGMKQTFPCCMKLDFYTKDINTSEHKMRKISRSALFVREVVKFKSTMLALLFSTVYNKCIPSIYSLHVDKTLN